MKKITILFLSLLLFSLGAVAQKKRLELRDCVEEVLKKLPDKWDESIVLTNIQISGDKAVTLTMAIDEAPLLAEVDSIDIIDFIDDLRASLAMDEILKKLRLIRTDFTLSIVSPLEKDKEVLSVPAPYRSYLSYMIDEREDVIDRVESRCFTIRRILPYVLAEGVSIIDVQLEDNKVIAFVLEVEDGWAVKMGNILLKDYISLFEMIAEDKDGGSDLTDFIELCDGEFSVVYKNQEGKNLVSMKANLSNIERNEKK